MLATLPEPSVSLPLAPPPRHLCLLRLSALGDITHVLPLLRTLQAAWPQTQITWIIGAAEAALVEDLPSVELIRFHKRSGWRGYWALYRQLRQRRFDLLLHLQTSLRASLIALLIHSPIKLGFDRARAKDLQWLFTTHQIGAATGEHVLESLLGFATAIGIQKHRLSWELPVNRYAAEWVAAQFNPEQPLVVISPCASVAQRNWSIAGYAAVARVCMEQYGCQVVLSGGPSATEHHYGAAITAQAPASLQNWIGQSSLAQLVALLARADLLIAPDSGPAHIATAVGTPVIGLYAATNPDRARPYLSAAWLVNRYPEALHRFKQTTPERVAWGARVHHPDAMNLISVEAVLARVEEWWQQSRWSNS